LNKVKCLKPGYLLLSFCGASFIYRILYKKVDPFRYFDDVYDSGDLVRRHVVKKDVQLRKSSLDA